jgi:ABC-type nitrate/sulfonate/bicarbonate transport system substrate-binding protein
MKIVNYRMLLIALVFAASAHGAHLTRIVLVTDGKAQAEQAGFYEALALGLYKKRGLEVTIRAGEPDLAKRLASGNFTLAADCGAVLDLVKNGVPARAMMAVFQKGPGGGYANLVLAPQRWIDKKPDAVQAFYDASRDGWRFYLENDPAPADALIERDNPAMSPALLAQGRARMKTLVDIGDTIAFGIGAMTAQRWRLFFEHARYPKDLPYRNAYELTFMRNAPQYFE